MVLTIHHLENSQSLRVVWLLEEIGTDYEIKLYKRNEESQLAPPELKAISPLGTSPAITDESGIALCETNAIIEYILDKSGNTDFRPASGSPERVDYLFFFHAAQGSLGATVTGDVVWKTVVGQVPCPLSSIMKIIYGKVRETLYEPRITKFMEVTEAKLEGRDFVAASSLTAADITLIFPMEQVFEMDPAMEQKFPKCKAWVDRMHAREAHKRAVAKVGEM
jgi:glutathione S-transferase